MYDMEVLIQYYKVLEYLLGDTIIKNLIDEELRTAFNRPIRLVRGKYV